MEKSAFSILSSSASPDRIEPASRLVLWLQATTLLWMLVECGISLYSANAAHSAALLAFGADSLAELLSASVVLLAFAPFLTKNLAAKWAGILLYVLAAVVALTAVSSFIYKVQPQSSCSGIAITIAALVVMPMLAWLKRRTAKQTGNRALEADAVQSATCAYLAAITLAGLIVNAWWHIHWIDLAAALAALPILIIEARRAMRGETCGCCSN
jgi:divalent metal cation (Fe/Co/Zn/Cd) transporter